MARLYPAFALAAVFLGAANMAQSNNTRTAGVTGVYVEARTCDVWTGPCFANADFNLSGKNGVLAWKIERGYGAMSDLEGLNVVAVVAANNTIGLTQEAPAKAIVIVDSRANASQREALVRFAKEQGGSLLNNVVNVYTQKLDVKICPCDGNGCAEVDSTNLKVRTRCLDKDHDKVCGNESAFYPPIARNVNVTPAAASEHQFRGEGLGHTYQDNDRRGAYVGTFDAR